MILRKENIVFWVALIILITPIGFYTYNFTDNFELGLWDNHSQWSEMGGYLSGIYAPILGVFTLVVICNQLKLQRQSTELQLQSMLSSKQEVMIKSAEKLAEELSKECINDYRIIDYLILQSYNRNLEFSDPESLTLFHYNHSILYSLWSYIFSDLEGLKAGSKSCKIHNLYYTTTKARILVTLPIQWIKALEDYQERLHANSTISLSNREQHF